MFIPSLVDALNQVLIVKILLVDQMLEVAMVNVVIIVPRAVTTMNLSFGSFVVIVMD